jgi:hypothetical protein
MIWADTEGMGQLNKGDLIIITSSQGENKIMAVQTRGESMQVWQSCRHFDS